MLTKNDLKLFEILDEYIDKSLTFGCCIEADWEYWLYTSQSRTLFWLQSIGWDMYADKHKDNCNKLWHYPTLSTVLMYLMFNDFWIEEWNYKHTMTPNHLFVYNKNNINAEWCLLDLTKELKDRTEQQKEELISFLLSI